MFQVFFGAVTLRVDGEGGVAYFAHISGFALGRWRCWRCGRRTGYAGRRQAINKADCSKVNMRSKSRMARERECWVVDRCLRRSGDRGA